MKSTEKSKFGPSREQMQNPVTSLIEKQLLNLKPALEPTDGSHLAGTNFKTPEATLHAPNSDMPSLSSRPADLEPDNVFAFYPSGTDPSEADRPTLVDAVIEQLRQARLRRHRPH